ncbi:Predicted kinase, aminoglycoside phosphotransferase (APT) family [Lentzea albidocapillata subsp. violacea]|uniref:Predicted kinase, aminoglycoside phosphotransferase (APT) family n=1 Tax=Lentzea albidocapillata subsp. violacea TaxID=128104 RepID=A0A1G8RM99_9PSEU|nr:phosphotransferase family protein [Lentzea albidocapillata]SDJ18128.1 Predicted kinase, aminoglycoside phosphotransferase (APT) family [Lentzea albidocapillata subsp. violacea]
MTDLPGLDLQALAAHLGTGPLTGELFRGGRSNLTYRISDGTRTWVLRRPPLGHVLATAHDMAREFRVISALAGTTVPVPAAHQLVEDTSVIGAPFYLMQEMPGAALRERGQCPWLTPEDAAALSERLVDVLADLHSVDPASVGLQDFGRPEGFMARQVKRWGKQLDASRSRDLPGIEELRDKLAATVPDSPRAAIIHGDYRLDNALVTRDPLAISAVLDWEMATLGDPLADLGLLYVYWAGLGVDNDPITGSVPSLPGFLSADELVARYTARTGTDTSGLGWYIAFGYFKLAVIVEGIHFRFASGKTVGAGFEKLGAFTVPLVRQGLAAAHKEL